MENLTFYCTTSHGYLEVNKDFYKENRKDFKASKFSFKNSNCLYLEEDCDAPEFLKMLRDNGITFKIEEAYIDELKDVVKGLRRC